MEDTTDGVIHISKIFDKRIQPVTITGPKIDHEFQSLALLMTTEFGIRHKGQIWGLFRKPEYTVRIINDAFLAYQRGKVKNFKYFMGILTKKKLL